MTAKAEFKKWYSACRACVRDQRNAGADGRFIADHKGVRFSAGYVVWMNGLERADLYKARLSRRYDHVLWHDRFNDIRAKWERMGLEWYRATLGEMASYRLHNY